MEEVLFKFEKNMTKKEIAERLDQISEKLRSDSPIFFESDESVELNPSQNPEFEIKVKKENGELSLELEIEWAEGEKGENDLRIS